MKIFVIFIFFEFLIIINSKVNSILFKYKNELTLNKLDLYKTKNKIKFYNKKKKGKFNKILQKRKINKKLNPIFKNNYKTLNNKNKRILNELNIKCKRIDYANSLCFECNKEKGYYPLYYDYNYDERKIYLSKYIKKSTECYNETTVPIGYYFNKNYQAYEKCYESCKKCLGNGNRIFHNCSSCIDNFIFQPEIPLTKNCIPKCKYYYYYSFVGDYGCTNNYHCPEKINLVVVNKNKCLSDCKHDDSYKYQYNGECLLKCPENTNPSSQNQCLDNDLENCTISIKNSILKEINLNVQIIDELAKSYATEFYYTQNHILQYKIENTSIIFLKNISCLENYKLSFSKIFFGEIYENILNNYNFNSFPILSIIDYFDFMNNPTTRYVFYEPIKGEKLDITRYKNSSIIINKNISYLLKEKRFIWLLEQNIDIFNLTSQFYSNICLDYKSNNGRDITLKDRILNFFPNISFCNDECTIKNLNYDKQIVACKCNFTNFSEYTNFEKGNIEKFDYFTLLVNSIMLSYLKENKIEILYCYEKLFKFKYYYKNIGAIIIFFLIIIQIICTIRFCIKGFDSINKYIFYILENYIKMKKIKEENNSKNSLYNAIINTKNLMTTRTFPISKEFKLIKENIILDKNNLIPNDYSYNNISRNENTWNSQISLYKEHENIIEEIKSLKFNIRKKINSEISNNSNILINKNIYLEKDLMKYIKTSPNEMEFYEIIKYDKRKFCEYYWDLIKRNQIIIKTFIFKEETVPRELKIIFFIIYIEWFFIISIFYFSTDYISMLYYNERNKNFEDYIFESIDFLTVSVILISIFWYIMEFFFYNKKYIRHTMKKRSDDEKKLKQKIILIVKRIKVKYIIFIIISFIISTCSWYFVFCFNNIYPNSADNWIKLTTSIIILMQIITLVIPFFETCLRFLAIKCNSEKIYKLSTFINLN